MNRDTKGFFRSIAGSSLYSALGLLAIADALKKNTRDLSWTEDIGMGFLLWAGVALLFGGVVSLVGWMHEAMKTDGGKNG